MLSERKKGLENETNQKEEEMYYFIKITYCFTTIHYPQPDKNSAFFCEIAQIYKSRQV